MRTIWTFIDEAGGAATNVTFQNAVSRALAQIGWRGQARIRFVRVADDPGGEMRGQDATGFVGTLR